MRGERTREGERGRLWTAEFICAHPPSLSPNLWSGMSTVVVSTSGQALTFASNGESRARAAPAPKKARARRLFFLLRRRATKAKSRDTRARVARVHRRPLCPGQAAWPFLSPFFPLHSQAQSPSASPEAASPSSPPTSTSPRCVEGGKRGYGPGATSPLFSAPRPLARAAALALGAAWAGAFSLPPGRGPRRPPGRVCDLRRGKTPHHT
jgi:hypothetical protein